tara:strand:+ start:341 stop:1426 length:1086 start_codon:yes stop_codon:yes gene_type:complete
LKPRRFIIIAFVLLYSTLLNGQCTYNLNSYTHIDCYGDNTGTIDISISDPDVSFWWQGPNGFTSTSLNLADLFAGKYTLTIMENVIIGDTSSALVCMLVDTITIQQTIPVTASFILSGMCNEMDSADVYTSIWGGTPPYSTLWSTGDTARNTTNLAPNDFIPYTLTITDANFCIVDQYLTVPVTSSMNTFMSSLGVICKDDYSGSARVFVTQGTPPFKFIWNSDTNIIIKNDSFSEINSLIPAIYTVRIVDDMGCITYDTTQVKSNPRECLTIYRAFSPNDDSVNDFWEIENIHLYPRALILVYDRNGQQVFRRRNYENAEGEAFGGFDQDGRMLPSGTYYYVIDLENGDEVLKGTLTIVR